MKNIRGKRLACYSMKRTFKIDSTKWGFDGFSFHGQSLKDAGEHTTSIVFPIAYYLGRTTCVGYSFFNNCTFATFVCHLENYIPGPINVIPNQCTIAKHMYCTEGSYLIK